MNPRNILLKPLITEKTMNLVSEGKYYFVVSPKASKGAIKEAVANMFKVDVVSVSTLKTAKKQKKSLMKKRLPYQRSAVRKAIVKIKKGQKIELFDVKEKK